MSEQIVQTLIKCCCGVNSLDLEQAQHNVGCDLNCLTLSVPERIWCVSYSNEWGAQWQIFFDPAPWSPGEGSKGQISYNFNYLVNFKDFYTMDTTAHA